MRSLTKSLVLAAAVALFTGFGAVQSAQAEPVVFSASGSFAGGTTTPATGTIQGPNGNVSTINLNGVQLSFSGNTVTQTTPFAADAGNFNVQAPVTSATVPATRFTLTVNQFVPSTGSATAAATLTGTISSSSGFLALTFDAGSTTFSIGTVNYQILNLTSANNIFGVPANTLVLNNQGTNGGNTALTVGVTGGAPIPEPATMVLLGTGLAGVAGAVRRRKGRAQAEQNVA